MTLDDCQLILFSLPLVSVNDFPASEKKKKKRGVPDEKRNSVVLTKLTITSSESG